VIRGSSSDTRAIEHLVTSVASVPGAWRTATVLDAHPETRTAVTLHLGLDEPLRHRAGQHVVVRLTAPDGYTAQRSYSIASPPDDGKAFDLTIERLHEGEVSPFLHDVVEPGDELEVRGPIGGWFVWEGDSPALLVGGGSGVVPLMSMLRYARRLGTSTGALVRLVLSVRSPEDLYYADELPGPETTIVYTRVAPEGVARPIGRLAVADLGAIDERSTVYVCGSARFADGASTVLLEAGVPTERIRVERFGPTG
jgi:ferredoxin-NADP reductase